MKNKLGWGSFVSECSPS